MVDMETSVKILEEQLKLWDAKIDMLMAKAKVAGAEAQAGNRLRIDDILRKRAAAQAKIDEFKAAGDGKWDGLKAGIDTISRDLETTFRKLFED